MGAAEEEVERDIGDIADKKLPGQRFTASIRRTSRDASGREILWLFMRVTFQVPKEKL